MNKKIKKILNKKNKSKIICLTSYSKNIAEEADKYADIILVGDSLGSVLYNYDTTKKVTEIPCLQEVNIGFFLIADSIFSGLENSVRKMKEICNKYNLSFEISNLEMNKYKNEMKFNNNRMIAHNCHIYQSKDYAINSEFDLLYFVEDDYVHEDDALIEMIYSYQKFTSQLNNEVILCPVDYPYLYMNNKKTNILIGNKRHWRTIDQSLCTFMISKNLLTKYWDNLKKTCLDRNDPFEKHLNEIYKSEFCISPIKSLSLHLTNVNSSYGLSPFIDYKKLWNQNE